MKIIANFLNAFKKINRSLVLYFLFVISNSIWAQTNNTHHQVQTPPLLIFNALQEKQFLAAYKRAFDAYWDLKWVSLGNGPTSPAEKKFLDSGEIGYLYKTCRPHSCDKEFLYFIYFPASGRGWGLLSIRSDIEGLLIPSLEVENILMKLSGVRR
jgi:hypothetical protein